MPFTKGHTIRPHNPGRKKKESTEIKDIYEKSHTEIAKHMVAKALGGSTLVTCPKCDHSFVLDIPGTGDKDCLIHCDNRVLGRAKQETDLNIRATTRMAPEDYELATRLALEEEQKLLSEAKL